MMKKFRSKRLFLGVIMTLLSAATVFSQVDTSLFVVVNFIKVESTNHSTYLDLEQEIWKPMHQERVNREIIAGWFLYAVEFSGSGDEYNYVIITLYDDADKLENPWEADIPGKVHQNMKTAEILERTYETRDIVKSQLCYSIASAPRIPLERPAAYLQVNYMEVDPAKRSEYEQLETEIWFPIHSESIRSGRTAGWSLWSMLFPRGEGLPYQYLTLNAFSEYSYAFELDFSIPFSNIHPEKDYAETAEKTRQSRTIVRSELWDLIDFVIR
jgi:hypothetical protein